MKKILYLFAIVLFVSCEPIEMDDNIAYSNYQ